jgi:iron complex transport system substrate-binding protein
VISETEKNKDRKIVDMSGRTVVLPQEIKTIYGPAPYAFTMLCSLVPERLSGLGFPLNDARLEYLPDKLKDLPMIGGIEKSEAIADAKPDVVVVWAETERPFHRKSENILNSLGLPFVYVTAGDLVDLRDYPEAYSFLGRLLNVEKRAEKLAEYCQKTLKEAGEFVATVSSEKQPVVYYAEGENGLLTEFGNSLHVHLLELAGAKNAIGGKITRHIGMEEISFEQVLAADPDVILVLDPGFFKQIRRSAKWQKLRAVKSNAVHLIPSLPFNWFDRPPSFMRILGLKWLLKILYPESYELDHVTETRNFFRLFLNVEISAQQAGKIFRPDA